MLPSIFEDGHTTVGHNLVRCPTRADYRHRDCRREGRERVGEGGGQGEGKIFDEAVVAYFGICLKRMGTNK